MVGEYANGTSTKHQTRPLCLHGYWRRTWTQSKDSGTPRETQLPTHQIITHSVNVQSKQSDLGCVLFSRDQFNLQNNGHMPSIISSSSGVESNAQEKIRARLKSTLVVSPNIPSFEHSDAHAPSSPLVADPIDSLTMVATASFSATQPLSKTFVIMIWTPSWLKLDTT